MVDLQAQQQELLEKINRTSKNSSSPPSSDLPSTEKRPEKKKTGKKRGGQPGHNSYLAPGNLNVNSLTRYSPPTNY
ncbi:MAG: hypothetical protein IGS39_04420 [Calothrix sp. C42_A2020_038]|nr:hypothetical protein [Calothrix sp. C42_A2020_038]